MEDGNGVLRKIKTSLQKLLGVSGDKSQRMLLTSPEDNSEEHLEKLRAYLASRDYGLEEEPAEGAAPPEEKHEEKSAAQ